MDGLLYVVARSLVALLQSLPLPWVARLGRAGGALAFWMDARHRRVALRNLNLCFGLEKSPAEIHALAAENFRRIGENYACAIKTAGMTFEDLQRHVEFVGNPSILSPPADPKRRSVVAAIGHFGNFELYARFGQFAPSYQCGTTYRGLRPPSINRLLLSLRTRSGCRFFERRSDAWALKSFMNQPGIILGLLADQHAGDHGLPLPFLSQECSTSAAPAVFALRYRCAICTGVCFRVGLARWRIEAGAEIPTHEQGVPRSTEAIMLDVNRAFEAAVRRDPANWFWVHDRWKLLRRKSAGQTAKAQVSCQESEGGDQRSEVRDQKSVAGIQKPRACEKGEIGGENSEINRVQAKFERGG
jgi:lauroyl/myristoyl acyltransferase